jgi:DNA-directed RNA polymerase specialized sigma24 family protein
MDAFRQSARLTYEETLPEQIDDTMDAEHAISAAEDSRAVRDCLKELSAEHRMVVSRSWWKFEGGVISG